jgi:hypothetical protein
MEAASRVKRVSLEELGIFEYIALWLSFQRYALLLGALALAPLGLVWCTAAGAWWAWCLALLVAARLGGFALEIARRWPRKLRALRVASRRIALGRFTTAEIRSYCADPCFRVVARQILRRAGLPGAQARQIIREHARALRDEASEVVIFDHRRGEVRRISGGRTSSIPIPPEHDPPGVQHT